MTYLHRSGSTDRPSFALRIATRPWRSALALTATGLLLWLAAAPAASAADASPCARPSSHPAFGAVQYCPLWMPSRGYVPVHSLDGGRIQEVGRITRAGGVNWFVCQTNAVGGRTVRHRDSGHPQYTNVFWARTLSDTGAWGWVSAVYFQGGADDERDAGLRGCNAAEAGVTGTAPPSGSPAPWSPPPVRAWPSGTACATAGSTRRRRCQTAPR